MSAVCRCLLFSVIIGSALYKALPAIDLGLLLGPHGLVFVGGKTWFTAEEAKAIGSYGPLKKKVN